MKKQYYQICLRHMRAKDNVFQFWCENANGYTKIFGKAGLYLSKKNTFKEQVNHGDFLVKKEVIDNLVQKIRLPIYGDKKERYGGENEFFVLPNIGQVRKALGITTLDFKISGDAYNGFDAHFKDTVIEKFKTVYSKTHFTVNAKKDKVDEWWYCQDFNVEAKTRNEAIVEAQKEWNFEYDYIKFKSMVTCSRMRTTEFDKWVEL